MRTIKLTEETRKDLLEKLLKRSPNCYGEYEGRVTEIVNTVRAEGDKALPVPTISSCSVRRILLMHR